MYQVMMMCPITQREASTGWHVERPEHWEAITFVNSPYPCGACGETHLVKKRYARLEAAGGLAPIVS